MHAGANKIREKVSNAWLIEFLIFLCEFTATTKKKKIKEVQNQIHNNNYRNQMPKLPYKAIH